MKLKMSLMIPALFISAVFSGCEKETPEVQKVESKSSLSSEEKEIEKLKVYLSTLANVRLDEIVYDEVQKEFYCKGVNEINLHFLRLVYSQNNNDSKL